MVLEPPDDLELELIESTVIDDARSPAAPLTTGTPELEFTAEVWQWRGPAPYYFVTVSADVAAGLHAVAAEVTYGWGMIPVRVRIGKTAWDTAAWPKDGGYILGLKDRVRAAEELAEGNSVTVQLVVRH
jgi:hypothetical protein